MPVFLKRVYEPASDADGVRVLVDRLWPRALRKQDASIHRWLRDVAPSTDLRRWFHQNPSQWLTFRKRYLAELREPEAEAALQKLYALTRTNRAVTLLFASRNCERNNAVVLKELLEGMRKPPTSAGALKATRAARARQAR